MKRIILTFLYALFRCLPVNRRKVLLFSYYGEQYSGSPKYISLKLQEKETFRVLWAFTVPSSHPEYSGEAVRYGRPAFFFHLATAGTVITNYRMTEEYVRRNGQKYIQTWHSSLRLKQIEKDTETTLPPHYVKMAKRDSSQISILLAGSKKSREIFERAFWYGGRIENTGTPQCDILFDDRKPYREKASGELGYPSGAHVALYAPTFRKNNDLSVYQLDFHKILHYLSGRFGGEWVMLVRLHPHLSKLSGFMEYDEQIIDATAYDDVQELLSAADVLISDYSAIMFDFSVTGRPCFLYTPDLEEYTNKDRNLYFDIRTLPFPLALSQTELYRQLEDFSDSDYSEKLSGFLQNIGSFDDGLSAERVVKLIQED